MLYWLLKIPAKLAFLLYCRHIKINDKSFLNADGPLLIAANHPNSFLDAIIIATIFKRPVYSLTRGDVYKNNFVSRLLTSMKMLPIYRISEGSENLEHNYKTFDHCKEIFKNNGIVLIFSEGRCENEWHLRPLKKGTARLAVSTWQEGIPLKILPAGINYQSFRTFGKNVELNFGDIINEEDIDHTNGQARTLIDFNDKLQKLLKPLVVEIPSENRKAIYNHFYVNPILNKTLLAIPAMLGWLLHSIIYIPIQRYTWFKASDSGHYDSILIALLFTGYIFYLGVMAILISVLAPPYWWLAVFIVFPFCAWSYLHFKKQF